MNDGFRNIGSLARRFRPAGQQETKRLLCAIYAREQFQEMTTFRIDPLNILDQ